MLFYLLYYYRRALKGNLLMPMIVMNICWTGFVIIGFIEPLDGRLSWSIVRLVLNDILDLAFIRVLFRIKASTIYVNCENKTEADIRQQLRNAEILEVFLYLAYIMCDIT